MANLIFIPWQIFYKIFYWIFYEIFYWIFYKIFYWIFCDIFPRWRIMFVIPAGIYSITAILFLLFGRLKNMTIAINEVAIIWMMNNDVITITIFSFKGLMLRSLTGRNTEQDQGYLGSSRFLIVCKHTFHTYFQRKMIRPGIKSPI